MVTSVHLALRVTLRRHDLNRPKRNTREHKMPNVRMAAGVVVSAPVGAR